jgi:tetratricopeptide (TPR) repeat protein
MLETMREFALDLLQTSGELEVLHARHAAYLLQMAGQVITALKDSGHTDAIVGLGRERDNLRAALAWLASLGDQQPALRLAAAAAWVWMAEGQVAEGREQLTRLLALTPEPTPARATALLSAAMLAWGQGDYQMQERLARESLAIAQAEGLPEETAEALSTLGAAAFQRGEYDTARGLLVESLDRFRGLGQRLGIGWALMRLASVARDQGQFAEAERLYEEALALRRAAGDRTGVAHILSNLSWLALYAGAHARARTLQEESLVIRREGGDRREVAMSLIVLARIALAQGARTAAWAPLQEGIDLCRAIGDRWAIALALEALAGLIAMNQPASALRLAGAAATLRAAIGRPMPAPERPIVEAWLEPAWRALGEAATAAWAAGASMPLDSIAQQLLIEFDTAAACPPRSP